MMSLDRQWVSIFYCIICVAFGECNSSQWFYYPKKQNQIYNEMLSMTITNSFKSLLIYMKNNFQGRGHFQHKHFRQMVRHFRKYLQDKDFLRKFHRMDIGTCSFISLRQLTYFSTTLSLGVPAQEYTPEETLCQHIRNTIFLKF